VHRWKNETVIRYDSLENCARIKRGTRITKSEITDSGTYPVISGGEKPMGFYEMFNRDSNTITIAQYGAAGYVDWQSSPFWANDVCYCIYPSSELNNRFLYHVLKSNQNYLYSQRTKAIPAHLPLKILSQLMIPIPPLEIQNEIVCILDSFAALTAELTAKLTAELTARKKQYEFYRNKVLSLSNFPYYSLESVCNIVDYRGKTPKKVDKGVFLVTAKNIRMGYIDYSLSSEYVLEEDYDEIMHRGKPRIGDVLITTEAPCGFVAQIDREDVALAQRVIKYSPKNPSFLEPTYLKYILMGDEFQHKLNNAATGSTVKGIKGSKLHQLTIPIPDISKQREIISILKQFETLSTDIIIGLPAEIASRQKQYEYYRDKLLSFTTDV